MNFETIDVVVRHLVNKLREEKAHHIEQVISGLTPGDEYFKATGFLRGLQWAEEVAKSAARELMKEDSIED